MDKVLITGRGEIYTTVTYGFVFFPCADLWAVATIPCCPHAPSWHCLQGARPWSWSWQGVKGPTAEEQKGRSGDEK